MAIGDIIGLLDSETFVQNASQPIILRKRNKNIVLLCSTNIADNLCLLRSISINDLGIITATPEDSLVLGILAGRDMGLIHWHDDIFVVLVNLSDFEQHLWTVACDGSGNIPASPTDTMQISNANNFLLRSDLIKPHSNVLLIGGSWQLSPNAVETALISDAGFMGASPTDSMDFPIAVRIQRSRHGSGDRIVELYTDAVNVIIATYACTSGGALSANPIDSWTVTTYKREQMSLCKVSDTVYAMFFIHSDNKAMLHTFSINPDGTINKSYLDSEQVELVVHYALEMVEMGGGYFLLGYRFNASIFRLKTYFIAPDGAIQDGHIGTFDRAVGTIADTFLEHLHGDIWTVVYTSPGTTIHLLTVEIEMPVLAIPHHEMIMKIGP